PPMSKIVAVRPESPFAMSVCPNVDLVSWKLCQRALRANLNHISNAAACCLRSGLNSQNCLSFFRLMTFTASHYAKYEAISQIRLRILRPLSDPHSSSPPPAPASPAARPSPPPDSPYC